MSRLWGLLLDRDGGGRRWWWPARYLRGGISGMVARRLGDRLRAKIERELLRPTSRSDGARRVCHQAGRDGACGASSPSAVIPTGLRTLRRLLSPEPPLPGSGL